LHQFEFRLVHRKNWFPFTTFLEFERKPVAILSTGLAAFSRFEHANAEAIASEHAERSPILDQILKNQFFFDGPFDGLNQQTFKPLEPAKHRYRGT
jgi:hypothetical protein